MAKGSLSKNGFEFLKKSEGYRAKAYRLKDKNGNAEKYCTCCMGHYGADVDCDKTYTNEECMSFFSKDSVNFTRIVNQVYDTDKGMTQNMFDAMFSFVYNCGSFKNAPTLKAAIMSNPRDFSKIQSIWEQSCIKGASPSFTPGLKARRKREAKLYCGEAYSSESVGDGYDFGSESSAEGSEGITIDPVVYQEVKDGVSSVNYKDLNSGDMIVRIDDDQTYEIFTLIQDSSNAALGANGMTYSTANHGEAASNEDHMLIQDETIKPTIAQDEHSNKVKEDTDQSESVPPKNVDTMSVDWVEKVRSYPISDGGFAI